MALPAKYAALDGLVDLLVLAILDEIEAPASEPLPQSNAVESTRPTPPRCELTCREQ
jgi:hypothetical protein